MPPKKKSAAPKASDAPPPEAFTPERFERELKDLASKAQENTWSRNALGQLSVYVKTALVLSLLGVYSNVSQLALSPVYGSIPVSIWHSQVLMVGSFIGWSGNLLLRRSLAFDTSKLLPLIALYIPVLQFFLYSFSNVFTAKWGPVITESLTLLPLAAVSAACAADYLEGAQLGMLPQFFADATPGIGSWGFFKLMESTSAAHLQRHIGQAFVFTRSGLQMLLAASYTVFAPSKYLLLSLPALLHTAVLNTHVLTPMATSSLNNTLLSQEWMLLDRKESLTGYISVLENSQRGYRVMRCDHSLLGGEWVRLQGKKVSEPIYGVFVMLEAVRLVERQTPLLDSDASALVVGLGIGTTPSALVSHGIDTSVVEIDPVVYEFAVKHFNLKENNPPAITDAVGHTASLAEQGRQYDYIVHDVFTGGAEPIDLFTFEFLQNLSSLLKPDGVIAINYAGDFGLPTPKMIVRTIREVFPSCRIFRESPRDEQGVEDSETDFTNMVIFCRKSAEHFTFRKPVQKDFLRSHARQSFLEPKHEVEEVEFLEGDETGLLLKNNTAKVTKWHQKSALGHWNVMRTVMPAKIWEMW